jgi:hypothetical protein
MLIGWLIKDSLDHMNFLEVGGKEISYAKDQIVSLIKLGINDSISGFLKDYCGIMFCTYRGGGAIYEGNNNMPYYLVSLWEYQKGNKQLAYKLLKESIPTPFMDDIKVPLDVIIERHFGNYYYNLMLIAYTHDRDYAKAIKYGSYFNFPDFNNFYYTKTAVELTNQLKQRENDFKSFCMPDSLTWLKLKNEMDRKEQLEYLIERLKLLNCLQWG